LTIPPLRSRLALPTQPLAEVDPKSGAERRAEPAAAEKNSFSPTDKEVVQQLIGRLRRNMCDSCPKAAQRVGPDSRLQGGDTGDGAQVPIAA
jgi:hypothetical protein